MWYKFVYVRSLIGCHDDIPAGMLSVSLEDADLYGVSMKMSIDEKVEHFSVSSRAKGLIYQSVRKGLKDIIWCACVS